MSGKVKNRSAANAEQPGGITCDERILRECYHTYTQAANGLIAMGLSVGVNLLPPRKKVTVMLVGNHSAGKSSFINWYVEEQVQRTGVAIETQGFSFVTSGKKRESLTGNATLHLYPHFKPLQQVKGVSEYLTTEICTSRQKRFSLVTFVDTPGLVDGDVKYPFDVSEAILWLGNLCDLILVFFDPMGQALCKRTLDIVEKLNERQGDRLRFYFSKADEAGNESDRQRVMMQIVQELCKRSGLDKCAFQMPTIYIPHPNKPSRCTNEIEEVCQTIEKSINQAVQNTLNTLEKDCEVISNVIQDKLDTDRYSSSCRQSCRENRRAQCQGCILGLVGFSVPFFLVMLVILGNMSRETVEQTLGEQGTELLIMYLGPVERAVMSSSFQQRMWCCGALVQFSVVLLVLAHLTLRTRPSLTSRQKKQLQEKLKYLDDVVKSKKKRLYDEYLRQSAADHDGN
ncbi:uncharacterized protein LOC111840496 isoform X3 [Arapaima gigas]